MLEVDDLDVVELDELAGVGAVPPPKATIVDKLTPGNQPSYPAKPTTEELDFIDLSLK
jgi:hypothetical protein